MSKPLTSLSSIRAPTGLASFKEFRFGIYFEGGGSICEKCFLKRSNYVIYKIHSFLKRKQLSPAQKTCFIITQPTGDGRDK
jgi:hypothetical protein